MLLLLVYELVPTIQVLATFLLLPASINLYSGICMQKSVQNGVISVQDIHNKGFKLIIASLALLLIVLSGIGVLLFQTPLQESQDIRQQASVDQGMATITTTATQLLVGEAGSISLQANSQNLPISQIRLVFNVVTTTFDTPELILATGSPLELTESEVEQTADGYLVSLIAQPAGDQEFRPSSATTFAALRFTPHEVGNVELHFDAENSQVFLQNVTPSEDELTHVTAAQYEVTTYIDLPACIYTYSDWGTCTNQSQTRSVLSKTPAECHGDPLVSQRCESSTTTSLNWNTGHVSLTADNFYLVANGQRFSEPFTNLSLTSDAPTADGDNYTTLEATWTENGLPMRLSMYFKHDGTDWWSNELRIYNGENPGDWIYFQRNVGETEAAQQKAGAFFTTRLTDSFASTGTTEFTTSASGIGQLVFENLRLQAFTQYGKGGTTVKACNESCSSNAECGVNQRCHENHCRLVTNVSSETCSEAADAGLQRQCNQYCADSRECASGLSCYYNRCRRANNPESTSCALLSNTATQNLNTSCNTSCTSNTDCAANLRCHQGKCRLVTNVSSSSCSPADSKSVSQPWYGGKGSTTDGTTAPSKDAGGSASIDFEATAGGKITPTPTPTPVVTSTPQPTPKPVSGNDDSALNSVLGLLAERGIGLPVLLLGAGLLVLAILVLSLLSRLGKKKKPSLPTPPPTNTPQMKSLEQRIAHLQQQAPGSQLPGQNTTAQPTPTQPSPAGKPLPTVPTQPAPVQPISAQPTSSIQPPKPPQPNVPAVTQSITPPAFTIPKPAPVQTPTQPTPISQPPKPIAPLTPEPTPLSTPKTQPQPTAQPLVSAAAKPVTPPLLLPKADELELPAHTTTAAAPDTTTPSTTLSSDTEKNRHTSMMARIRAKGLMKGEQKITESKKDIFESPSAATSTNAGVSSSTKTA